MKHTLSLILFLYSSCLFSDQESRFLGSISSYLLSFQKYLVKYNFPVVKPKQEIQVSLSSDLSDQEHIFLKNRLKKTTKTLQDDFGIDVPLKIAFCCSGGGNRAMIGMLGMLSAAAKTKLLDATLYLAGVSGSTWTIIPYFYQQACLGKNSLQAVSDLDTYFSTALSSGSRICFDNYCSMALLPFNYSDDFFKDLVKRYAYDQDLSLINIYGPLIAHQTFGFLGDQALQIKWSDLMNDALLGNAPLPICASAFNDASGNYGFFEMSPFESGNPCLGYIPTQYLGSKFTHLKLDQQGICPEYPIAFYMGVYGSAFAIITQDLYYAQLSKDTSIINPLLFLFEPCTVRSYNPHAIWNSVASFFIKNKIEKIFISLLLENAADDLYAFFPNYNFQALNNNKNFGLFDAGIACNFPIAMFIDRPQREVDLIIMYDSNPGSPDVATVYDYALEHGISFDIQMKNLSINELSQSSMFVFNDPASREYNASSATILYFPTQSIDISNPPYTTFNFKYEMNDSEKLKEIQERAFISNFERIKNIMKLLTQRYKN